MAFFPQNSNSDNSVISPALDQNVEDFIGERGYFYKNVEDFKFREGQLKMAQSWQHTLIHGDSLICEAGTGTGKTFAYLIPALLSRKSFVISTASKALQDQLVLKDLPAVFSLLKIDPDFMSLKGFGNYLCLERYESVKERLKQTLLKFVEPELSKSSDKTFDPLTFEGEDTELTDGIESDEEALLDNRHALTDIFTKEVLEEIDNLILKTEFQIENNLPNIDFAEVNSKFSWNVTSRITRSPDTCIGKKCKYFEQCYAFRARLKAVNTKVVVINHSLFFSDLNIDDVFNQLSPCILLPKYKGIVFDEAHELPAIGREHLSEGIGSVDLRKFKEHFRHLVKGSGIPKKPFEERIRLIDKAYRNVFAYLNSRSNNEPCKRNFLYYKYFDYDDEIKDPYHKFNLVNNDFRLVMGELYKVLREYQKFIHDNIDYDEDYLKNVEKFTKGKADLIVKLMNIDLDDKDRNPHYGHYVAIADLKRRDFVFSLTPLEITQIFGNYLSRCCEHSIGVLMTSATLSVAHKFDKFIRDTGASSDTECLEVESPFNYPSQSMIFRSPNFPVPEEEGRIDFIIDKLSVLFDKVEGGVFFLTTSHSALNAAHTALYRRFHHKRKIFCQNTTLSNSQMLKEFKADGHAILIGTSSFWAGVDVPGRALSLVVIDKFPFETPSDPIFKARCRYFDADNPKSSSFMSISVPEAVISLRQGAGRLIRHEDDRGGLVICDPRLETARYAGIFKKSLPDMYLCEDLNEMIEFCNSKPPRSELLDGIVLDCEAEQ